MSTNPPTVSELRQRPFVTVAEAAAVLSLAPVTVYRMAAEGRLRSAKVGGSVRVPSAHLLELLGEPA